MLKMGRTHLQDAVPMSLGQEFHGWGTTIGEEVERIAEVRQFLHLLVIHDAAHLVADAHVQQVVGQAQADGCLLYTSRCV